MHKIIEDFNEKASFKDENEANVIRQRLERFVNNILAEVEKRDERFQTSLIQSGSVYEGVKVHKPDEFDFMIRINSLSNKPFFLPCDKGDGYVKLVTEDDEWIDFKDDEGFFNPNKLCRHFKKLINESLNFAEVPEGLNIMTTDDALLEGAWGPVYSNVLGNSRADDNPFDVMYSETHGPATTLYITWNGGSTYSDLTISVDLTLSLEYDISKLPVQLSKLPRSVEKGLQDTGFHVVPAGFDTWRISFSMIEKQILSRSPDGFKACYRVLKITRDTISEELGLDPSLVPSYIFKTVLQSQLFAVARDCWKRENWPDIINHVLDVTIQGVMRVEINSFFLSRYNLLSKSDHENNLKQCILEEMITRVQGLKMKHTPQDVTEAKRQVRVLELIDLFEYVVFAAAGGKDPTALWNKMFVNIGNIPGSRKFGWFWNQITDLKSTSLDEEAYKMLCQMWRHVESTVQHLRTSLQGNLSLLALKFYMRLCEKKKEFEQKNNVKQLKPIKQISIQQMAQELFEDIADSYLEEKNSSWSNLHKAVPSTHKPSGLFKDVADQTVNAGSEKGLAMFKHRIKGHLNMVPESALIRLTAHFVGQIIYYARDMLSRKLEYITIPELDLD
ncbi:cyclic GMP-AMP synthase-like receptor [Montipora capricornis]|uniref:cyclic GMP-AMP synthase-like receptor n=1 Tax=Montipora capricornis TaxID=246305 RepID=UPI0035F20551